MSDDERAANPYMAAFDVIADMENGYLIPDDAVREIVDAALASTPGLDELLDSVHPGCGVHVWLEAEPDPDSGVMGAHYMATLYLNGNTSVFGDGTTRIDALRDAVVAALDGGHR